MIRKTALAIVCFLVLAGTGWAQKKKGKNAPAAVVSDRTVWLRYMDKVARPVLSNLAEDKLKEIMPVVLSKKVDNRENRLKASYLEAFARTLCGISPWLNSEGGSKEETDLRNQYRQWALKAIANAVNPSAKDYLTWVGGQPLVEGRMFEAFFNIRVFVTLSLSKGAEEMFNLRL